MSVVMPSLNQGRFIDAAVRSVLGSGLPGIELIVTDGGSSDDTLVRLSALGEKFDGRLRWSSQPDDGPAHAINRAVAQARAPWIGWLNSDDLYADGAIARALAHAAGAPNDVMVYGQGDHVDEQARFIERYPTRPPSTPLGEFRHGCFICQPTAFFRREAFDELGGLDTSLRAAFDFDLWLRLFKRYPGRIGFIDDVQALSRLHEAGITLSQRGRVAREGITVLGRHLGMAPAEWGLTWLEELCAQHPFHRQPLDLREQLDTLAADCRPALGTDGFDRLRGRVAGDARVRFASPQVFVGVGADGWATSSLEVRVLQQPARLGALRLRCAHVSPVDGPLRLLIVSPDGGTRVQTVDGPGEFEIVLDVSQLPPGARAIYRVRCEPGFVPAHMEPGSTDTRTLAFKVEACQVVPAAA